MPSEYHRVLVDMAIRADALGYDNFWPVRRLPRRANQTQTLTLVPRLYDVADQQMTRLAQDVLRLLQPALQEA